jgi:hypothetical protein
MPCRALPKEHSWHRSRFSVLTQGKPENASTCLGVCFHLTTLATDDEETEEVGFHGNNN